MDDPGSGGGAEANQDGVVAPLHGNLVEVGIAQRDGLMEPPLGLVLGLVLLGSLLSRLGGGHQMWMAFPSTAIAASMTASLSVGCGWLFPPTSPSSPCNTSLTPPSPTPPAAPAPTPLPPPLS